MWVRADVGTGAFARSAERSEAHFAEQAEVTAVTNYLNRMLSFRQLPGFFSVVRLAPKASIPAWATDGEFTSITRTADELSIVCPANNIPKGIDPGPRWICLKLEGPFPFSQTGVLLSFIEPLSNHGIPIFAISTYDTDFVLIQEEFSAAAIDQLQAAGHELLQQEG